MGARLTGTAKTPDEGEITPREMDVIHCIIRGMCNKEIAAHLSIAYETVRRHLVHIFKKTGATTRLELAQRFRDSPLLKEDQVHHLRGITRENAQLQLSLKRANETIRVLGLRIKLLTGEMSREEITRISSIGILDAARGSGSNDSTTIYDLV